MADPLDCSAVFDASAVLALLRAERGHERAVERLDDAVISAVNWAEVRAYAAGHSPNGLRERLEAAGLRVVSFTTEDADRVGDMWLATRDKGLGIADRACLALAQRLGVPAVTADRAWAELDLGVEVVLIR